jgi:hypothetical protein
MAVGRLAYQHPSTPVGEFTATASTTSLSAGFNRGHLSFGNARREHNSTKRQTPKFPGSHDAFSKK